MTKSKEVRLHREIYRDDIVPWILRREQTLRQWREEDILMMIARKSEERRQNEKISNQTPR